jgi:exodeoxyribonuclease V alpha subunit
LSLPHASTAEITVEGVVDRITFENPESGFRVLKVSLPDRADVLAVVGVLPPVQEGSRVRIRGRLEVDRTHGEQFHAESILELAPDTLVGLEKYLGSGLVKGVGPKLAQRVVAAFGLQALRVLDESPERLREVPGLGKKRRDALLVAWGEQRALRDVMVFLQAHGASLSLAMRILRRYGAAAMGVVSREPFRLALEVRGVGFKTADRIAASLGIAHDSPERVQAGVMQVIHDVTAAGHVWTSLSAVQQLAARLLAFDVEGDEVLSRLRSATEALARAGLVVVCRDASEERVYAASMHAAELRVAGRLSELCGERARPLSNAAAAIRDFERTTGTELAPEQRDAVEQAARSAVLVITGGPGVGKTTLVKAILAAFARAELDVRLAAPTGRAAKRLSEATGAEACTLHRLLEFDPRTATFKRDARRPIEAGAVIVDEASMVDLPTADALLDAIAPGTRLLFVGDVDQLPSVGPGAVLRDVIASGEVPCVRLKQVFRQAARSLIVTNAHRINRGEAPILASGDAEVDFFVLDRRDPDHARSTLVELVASRIPHKFGLDPVRDIQVLTPMNRGPVGAVALNEALRAALNPIGPALAHGTRSFRVGDKVMQLRNDYERGVYNGDTGVVVGVNLEEGSLTARFDEREVTFERADLDDVVLAYACTVHKAQGSEYPAVVMVLLTAHFVMLSKNLLYTAVTRGKRLVVLVSDPRALELALREPLREERRSALASRVAALGRLARGH